jgi:uncharacterized protein (DUF58 family)
MLSDRALRNALDQFRLAREFASAGTALSIEVLLDASPSMSSGDGAKEDLSRELATLLLRLSELNGFRASACVARGGSRDRWIQAAQADRIAQVPFDGEASFFEGLEFPREPESSCVRRVIISDFLTPVHPAEALQRLARGASRIWLLQLLDDWEAQPKATGWSRLVDPETEETEELILDQDVIQAYLDLLDHCRAAWDSASREIGAAFISVSAGEGLEEVCRQRLVPAQLLCLHRPGEAADQRDSCT